MTMALESIGGRWCWTEGQTKVLIDLWNLGDSCSVIADKLGGGLTRNAVIGKVHRLGLPARKTSASKQRNHWQAKPKRKNKKPTPYVLDYYAEFKPIEQVSIPIGQRRKLLELTSVHCRYPIGDPRTPDLYFCGARKASSSSYCHQHTKVCQR